MPFRPSAGLIAAISSMVGAPSEYPGVPRGYYRDPEPKYLKSSPYYIKNQGDLDKLAAAEAKRKRRAEKRNKLVEP